jgi:hypothetical protein
LRNELVGRHEAAFAGVPGARPLLRNPGDERGDDAFEPISWQRV